MKNTTTPALDAWQEYWAAYQLAGRCETIFTNAVIRQFGRKRAADMRYQTAKFNHDTGMAALAKQWADADMQKALEYARSFPVMHTFLNVSSVSLAEVN